MSYTVIGISPTGQHYVRADVGGPEEAERVGEALRRMSKEPIRLLFVESDALLTSLVAEDGEGADIDILDGLIV